MTVPMEFRTAQKDFDAFMIALRDRAMLQTTHQTYTMLDAVFRVFRKRLTLREFALFAGHLPPLLRALFIQEWDPDAPIEPFETRQQHAAEILAVRQDHNLSTPTAIEEVCETLRQQLGSQKFEDLMGVLTPEARAFWQV